ncbi:Chymotrypsin-1 [Operophtera brumata]|uniref:Chymotrypsin-1 n=1 Tax=Operophtera brumata TaxID=104452 RepID=A0A0L7LFE7_OPEBR|nr:Chymotrypsin-1 [Operophtera brumata]
MLKLTCVLILSLVASARSAMEGFIVGGQYAKIDNFAHSVFLDIYCVSKVDNSTSGWICGASVVNQKILLSAAHCLHDCSHRSHISIHVGNANSDRGQIYSLYSFVIHEGYNAQTNVNDICLVRVRSPLKFSRKASRVALMRAPPYTEKATVAGWGVIDVSNIGDSGSALMVRGYIQIGLVSYKIPTISKRIVVYTDVGYFYDWIKVYARELNCNN